MASYLFEAGELRDDLLGQLFKNLGFSIYGFLLQQLCFLIARWQGIVYTGLICCVWKSFFFVHLCFFVVVFTFINCKSSMPFLALDSHIAVILSIVV